MMVRVTKNKEIARIRSRVKAARKLPISAPPGVDWRAKGNQALGR